MGPLVPAQPRQCSGDLVHCRSRAQSFKNKLQAPPRPVGSEPEGWAGGLHFGRPVACKKQIYWQVQPPLTADVPQAQRVKSLVSNPASWS